MCQCSFGLFFLKKAFTFLLTTAPPRVTSNSGVYLVDPSSSIATINLSILLLKFSPNTFEVVSVKIATFFCFPRICNASFNALLGCNNPVIINILEYLFQLS